MFFQVSYAGRYFSCYIGPVVARGPSEVSFHVSCMRCSQFGRLGTGFYSSSASSPPSQHQTRRLLFTAATLSIHVAQIHRIYIRPQRAQPSLPPGSHPARHPSVRCWTVSADDISSLARKVFISRETGGSLCSIRAGRSEMGTGPGPKLKRAARPRRNLGRRANCRWPGLHDNALVFPSSC